MFDYLTIGYFQLGVDKLGALLQKYDVTAIADVRSSPFSRSYPKYNRTNIEDNLSQYNVRYVFLGNELGARPKDRSCYRDDRVDYDLLASSSLFQRGLERLEKGREPYRIALMCAERDPVTCHRAILVSRHLVEGGATVGHILHNGLVETHAEAMSRLIDVLGLSRKAEDHREMVEKHAYDLQGHRIAFHEARQDQGSSKEIAPRMI